LIQFDIFVKFFEMGQVFFIKIEIRIMSVILTKQTIIIYNFNSDEKTLIWFKKFNKKWQNCIIFSTIETKKHGKTIL